MFESPNFGIFVFQRERVYVLPSPLAISVLRHPRIHFSAVFATKQPLVSSLPFGILKVYFYNLFLALEEGDKSSIFTYLFKHSSKSLRFKGTWFTKFSIFAQPSRF